MKIVVPTTHSIKGSSPVEWIASYIVYGPKSIQNVVCNLMNRSLIFIMLPIHSIHGLYGSFFLWQFNALAVINLCDDLIYTMRWMSDQQHTTYTQHNNCTQRKGLLNDTREMTKSFRLFFASKLLDATSSVDVCDAYLRNLIGKFFVSIRFWIGIGFGFSSPIGMMGF